MPQQPAQPPPPPTPLPSSSEDPDNPFADLPVVGPEDHEPRTLEEEEEDARWLKEARKRHRVGQVGFRTSEADAYAQAMSVRREGEADQQEECPLTNNDIYWSTNGISC